VFGAYIGKDPNYPNANLGIWLLHSKIIEWGACLKSKNEAKFNFAYTRIWNNDYVKNVEICEILECDEEELKVLVLLDNPSSDLERMVGILCDARLLSDEMCRNLSLGLVTKARACKGAGQE
jgi:hypothetical protein